MSGETPMEQFQVNTQDHELESLGTKNPGIKLSPEEKLRVVMMTYAQHRRHYHAYLRVI